MAWRRIDLAVLVVGAVAEMTAGLVVGRHGLLSALVVGLVGLAAGATLRSPVPAGALTLVATFVLAVWLPGTFVLAPGAALLGAGSALTVRRRARLGHAISRLTTGTQTPHPLVPAWALIMAPLGAAGALWLGQRFFAPGEALGLSGSARHLVNGLCAVAVVVLAASLVTWRARAAGVPRAHAAAWALVSVGMALFWGVGIFLVVYLVNGPPGG